MVINLYAVKDKVKNRIINVSMNENDEDAVRENATYFMRILPMTDLELYKIGELKTELKESGFSFDNPRLIPWNIYNFHENKAAALEVFKREGEK